MSRDGAPRQRILIVARPAEGGIRSHIISLLRGIDRSAFDVALAAPAQLIRSLPENLPSFDVFAVPITAKPSAADLAAVAAILRLPRDKSTIVHAQGIRAAFIAAIALGFSEFPLIVTYHNVPEPSLLTRSALRLVSKRSAAAIAVSGAIAKRLPTQPITVIPNGIDLDFFSSIDRLSSRTDLQIAPSKTVVACVARLAPEKGVDILIESARLLPDISFLVAGNGPQGKELEDSAPPNVRFLGYVADVRQVLAAADAVVIPSRTEGQGIVALEAMACGVAVIAASVGGLAEMIDDGVNGVLAEPANPECLGRGIRELAADPARRARIGEAGKSWVCENGDVIAQIRKTEEVYSGVMAQRDRR